MENNWRVRILESGLDSCGVCDKDKVSTALSTLTPEGFTLFQHIMVLKERAICNMKEISGMDEKQTKVAIKDMTKNGYILFNKENNFYDFFGGNQILGVYDEQPKIEIDEIIFSSNGVHWYDGVINPSIPENWGTACKCNFLETPFLVSSGWVDMAASSDSPKVCMFAVIGNDLTKEIMISYYYYTMPTVSGIKRITPNSKTYNYFARILNLL